MVSEFCDVSLTVLRLVVPKKTAKARARSCRRNEPQANEGQNAFLQQKTEAKVEGEPSLPGGSNFIASTCWIRSPDSLSSAVGPRPPRQQTRNRGRTCLIGRRHISCPG